MDWNESKEIGDQIVKRELERLAAAEIVVPKRYSRGTLPQYQYWSECFPRAMAYVRRHNIDGLRYVIGDGGLGGFNRHAWVELPGDIIFDGVLQQFYDKTKYIEIEHVRTWYRFTRDAAVLADAQHFDTWQWYFELGLPWANFDDPQTITKEIVQSCLEKMQANHQP